MTKTILVTGSSGLVGRSCTELFLREGYDVYGIDNDARSLFFGKEASTRESISSPRSQLWGLKELNVDITNRVAIQELVKKIKPDAIIHTAAQPSHDKAAEIPFLDFETNAVGTLNLLESLRQSNLGGTFVHLSTNMQMSILKLVSMNHNQLTQACIPSLESLSYLQMFWFRNMVDILI